MEAVVSIISCEIPPALCTPMHFGFEMIQVLIVFSYYTFYFNVVYICDNLDAEWQLLKHSGIGQSMRRS
jgi:hypothetical protein